MHVLFIHNAFPAQFGRLALELTKRHGWRCTFLIEALSRCPTPTPEMLDCLELLRLPLSAEYRTHEPLPWPQNYARSLELSQVVFDTLRTRPDLKPDLVVAQSSNGPPTLFLPEVLACPIMIYCEYCFAPARRDLSYRIDLPPAEPAGFYPRCINAFTLLTLASCDAGYSPTCWQRDSFPARFHHKIEVHFDGIDTELYRPRTVPRVIAGKAIAPEMRIVTFVARGLESMRGFDLFMKVAGRIARERSDVLFVVVGSDTIYYGWDTLHTGAANFREWVLAQDPYDLSRFLFVPYLEPDALAELFCLSDLHFYLSVPFVLSWSMMNALASGCIVLASDVPPVREMIQPGQNGLVEPLFDVERLTAAALDVLDNPTQYRPLRAGARALVEEKYSLEVAVSALQDYFERVVAAGPRQGVKR